MQSKLFPFIIAFFFHSILTAQPIEFPLDTNIVTIDGVLNNSEWQNAETIMIGVNTTDNVQVMFKHDNTAIYFAFSGKLESANALFPEVLIDPQNVGGSSWSVGQWWFHVSATDCENDTAYGKYSNCMATQPDWEGAPNFTAGAPMTDTVEIRIPFSKVGFNPATMDTMGIVMMVSNTATIFRTYPTGSDKDVPNKWAKATFSKYYASVSNAQKMEEIKLFPNPAKNYIYLSGLEKGNVIQVYDMVGRMVETIIADESYISLQLGKYLSGVYTMLIKDNENKTSQHKIIKQ